MQTKNTKIEKQSPVASIIKMIGILILTIGVIVSIIMIVVYFLNLGQSTGYYDDSLDNPISLWSIAALIVGSVISWATLVGFGEIIDYLYKIYIALNSTSK